MQLEASLQVTWWGREFLKLLLNKLHLVLMKNFAAKLHLNSEVRETRPRQKVIQIMLLCIDANGTLLQLWLPATSYGSYQTETPEIDIAHLNLAISQTQYCR